MKQTRTVVVGLEHRAIYQGSLILVNQEHPIWHGAPVPDLTDVAAGVQMEKQAALLLEAVMRELDAAPHIAAVSGYRSREEQERIFADTRKKRGETYTRTYVALPGCSEHQTGLAIDLGKRTGSMDPIAPDFPYSGIYQNFREAAVQYGFIQRYPQGKEEITKIGHEPWHFRYVGIPHAELITSLHFTLEEYTQWMKGFPLESHPYLFQSRGRSFTIGYVPATDDITEIALYREPYTISGNNVDGFIVAVWDGAL